MADCHKLAFSMREASSLGGRQNAGQSAQKARAPLGSLIKHWIVRSRLFCAMGTASMLLARAGLLPACTRHSEISDKCSTDSVRVCVIINPTHAGPLRRATEGAPVGFARSTSS